MVPDDVVKTFAALQPALKAAEAIAPAVAAVEVAQPAIDGQRQFAAALDFESELCRKAIPPETLKLFAAMQPAMKAAESMTSAMNAAQATQRATPDLPFLTLKDVRGYEAVAGVEAAGQLKHEQHRAMAPKSILDMYRVAHELAMPEIGVGQQQIAALAKPALDVQRQVAAAANALDPSGLARKTLLDQQRLLAIHGPILTAAAAARTRARPRPCERRCRAWCERPQGSRTSHGERRRAGASFSRLVARSQLRARPRMQRSLLLARCGVMSWPPNVGERLSRADEAVGIEEKLDAYCLNLDHEVGAPKARGFQQILGIGIADIEYLADALRDGVRQARISEVRANGPYGALCAVQIEVTGLRECRERSAIVTTSWELRHALDRPRLVTAYIGG